MSAETVTEQQTNQPSQEAEVQSDQPETTQKTDEKSKDEKTVSPESKEKIAEQGSAAVSNLRVLENIEVKLTVEVGNTEIKIKDLLRLNEGSVVELERLAGEPLDILANGTKIAKGEVVMVGEKFGIRFTEVSDPEEMVQNL